MSRYNIETAKSAGFCFGVKRAVEIAEKTGASTATISRVNRVLNFGTNGLNEILMRMQEENEGTKQ